MKEDVLEAWRINNTINHKLLEHIPESAWDARLGGKGRNVWQQFGHIVAVRCTWLEVFDAKLKGALPRFGKDTAPDRSALDNALEQTAALIANFSADAIDNRAGYLRYYKRPVPVFLAYLQAHEAHHRGQILYTLKQAGAMPERKLLYTLWDWDTL